MLNRDIEEGLTFDDVALIPARSAVLPKHVDTTTRLTRRIRLNIPIVSAAMDTVTEAPLAIALARVGGIGIIHRVLAPEEQAAEVRKVKKSESGIITDPITISPDNTIGEAQALMGRHHISGIPVTENGRLVGIVTRRDLQFETTGLRVSEVMTTRDKLITTPEGATLAQASAPFQVTPAQASVIGRLLVTPHIGGFTHESLEAVERSRDLAALPRNDLASSPLSDELERLGAFRADVSGAGPAVYGLFEREGDAERAARELRGAGRMWLTRPVSGR